MNLAEQKTTEFLEKLGLTKEDTKIYLALIRFGNLTVLELARKTYLPRTSLYRKLENLQKRGIVEEIVEENSTRMKAAAPNKIELLVKDKELLAQELRLSFPNVSTQLLQMVKSDHPETKVLFYKGIEAIKQMMWNVLRAKCEFRGYSYRAMESVVGERFTEEWTFEFVKRGLSGRDIYSIEFVKSRKEFPMAKNANWSTWRSRYIPAKILNINHQIDIYNDVVAFYNWHEGEIFGVEIYNDKVASMQKQLFEMVWKRGKVDNTRQIYYPVHICTG